MATGGLWRKENRNEYKTEQIFGRGGYSLCSIFHLIKTPFCKGHWLKDAGFL